MSRSVAPLAVAALLAVLVTGCGSGFPKDPEGTLDRVRGGELQVGISERPPWTEVADSGRPSGVEVELVEESAERIDAEAVRYPGAESDLIRSLESGDLDVVVAGLTDTSPWDKHAALTRDRPPIGVLDILGTPVWAGWPMDGGHEHPAGRPRPDEDEARGGAARQGALRRRRHEQGGLDDRPGHHGRRRRAAPPQEVETVLRQQPWAQDVGVRVRDEGHAFHVEGFVVPVTGVVPTLEQLASARRRCTDLDRKVEDVVLAPVAELPEDQVPR
ncbi:transporter substrate-binding domain-containing protein [Kocuria sp. CPCC 205263]|uniref:transporter substrate-binding domain-containing protein n=1 Tax=Kocuria sp. CPCC 205263 TaxID=3073555 RepID=UPI0034D42D23